MLALQVGQTFESAMVLTLRVLRVMSLGKVMLNAAVKNVKFCRREFLDVVIYEKKY